MSTRRLGKSDLNITPVGFGAWALGGTGYETSQRRSYFKPLSVPKTLTTDKSLPGGLRSVESRRKDVF